MAASDNLMMPTPFEQWQQFKPINDTFDNEFLTNSTNDNVFTDFIDSILNNNTPVQTPTVQTPHTPTISTASENEVPAPKRRRAVPPTGKVSKRKSRASKRSMTTYITADAENFRAMVQQVTGVRLNGESPVFPEPEPQRIQQQQQQSFDTSSFLLDSGFMMNNNMVQPPTRIGGGGGFGFETFCSFPTLESSWKV